MGITGKLTTDEIRKEAKVIAESGRLLPILKVS